MSDRETLPPPPNIDPLLERGRIQHLAWIDRHYALRDRPIGVEGLARVRLDDFLAHTLPCLHYAITVRSLHILDRDGCIFALLQHSVRHAAP